VDGSGAEPTDVHLRRSRRSRAHGLRARAGAGRRRSTSLAQRPRRLYALRCTISAARDGRGGARARIRSPPRARALPSFGHRSHRRAGARFVGQRLSIFGGADHCPWARASFRRARIPADDTRAEHDVTIYVFLGPSLAKAEALRILPDAVYLPPAA